MPHDEIAALLMDAAIAVEYLSAEVSVQRGMAIASHALCDELNAQLDGRDEASSALASVRATRSTRSSPLGKQPASAWPLARARAARHAGADNDYTNDDDDDGSGSGRSDDDGEAHIEALVVGLKEHFRQAGVPLPLARQHGTVYRLGSRRVNLAVRDGRLAVVSAPGEHTDLLKFLSRSST